MTLCITYQHSDEGDLPDDKRTLSRPLWRQLAAAICLSLWLTPALAEATPTEATPAQAMPDKVTPSAQTVLAGVQTLRPAQCSQGIQARFFGTTTIELTDGKTTLMTDGFFSRPNPFKLLFTAFASDEQRINRSLAAGQVKTIDALLVSHSHHDHAMDTGLVALKTGAVVYGSPSVGQIVKGQNLPDSRFHAISDGDRVTLGDFKVTFYETPHSKGVCSATGGIHDILHPPARLSDYKLDENFSLYIEHGRDTMLIVPSGNYRPGKFRNLKADTVFLGIGGMRKQPDSFIQSYWNEVVRATGARQVILIHWDNFTRPLDKPLSPLPSWVNNTRHAVQVIGQMAKRDGISLAVMPLFSPIALNCNAPAH